MSNEWVAVPVRGAPVEDWSRCFKWNNWKSLTMEWLGSSGTCGWRSNLRMCHWLAVVTCDLGILQGFMTISVASLFSSLVGLSASAEMA